ncbi:MULTISPECIES: hypothetical protein [unclassified Clostridioides]|uniref:hypothetical protein n=1 Tax=unclassified Clostridioides TaxID=2635829 RepID=UPI001D0FEA65|nr:hypothetical protein [Clostridioides sp. ZZV14-6105]MCC0731914.1 hypothetical protein [Clostridioides sp. ZZV14-6048]
MNDHKEYIVTVKSSIVNLILGLIFLSIGIVLSVFCVYIKQYYILVITITLTIYGLTSILKYTRKYIIFDLYNIKVRKFIGREKEYSYRDITRILINNKKQECPVKIYVDNNKIAIFFISDKNYLSAIAEMKRRELPFDDKSIDYISDMPLWIPIQSNEIKKFCNEASRKLEKQVKEDLCKIEKEFGKDISFSFGIDIEENPFVCVFLVCIMKNENYTKVIKKYRGEKAWAMFPVYIVGPQLYKKEIEEGKFICNINYLNAFSGKMWSNFSRVIKKYGVQESEIDVGFELKSELD